MGGLEIQRLRNQFFLGHRYNSIKNIEPQQYICRLIIAVNDLTFATLWFENSWGQISLLARSKSDFLHIYTSYPERPVICHRLFIVEPGQVKSSSDPRPCCQDAWLEPCAPCYSPTSPPPAEPPQYSIQAGFTETFSDFVLRVAVNLQNSEEQCRGRCSNKSVKHLMWRGGGGRTGAEA